MKRIKTIFVAAMLLMCGQLFAADVISVKNTKGTTDFVVAPEEEFEVVVYLDNESKDFTTYFQLNLILPEGFSYVTSSATFNTERGSYGDEVFVYRSSDGLLYCETTDSEHWDDALKGTSGELFRFKLKAPSTVQEDPFEIKLTGIGFSNEDFETVELDDVSFNVTVGEAAAETVTVTLAKEYNTYVPDKALDFSGVDGIKAYYVTAVTATEATLTEATTVAAGEGIIISGTPANYPADYEVPVASGEVAKNDDNLLKTSGIAVNDYILYNGKFVLCSDGELAEGKAYLPASAITSGAKVINIVFGGESTGISEVKKSEADSAIYNLSGMRVSKTQKGVYIMNGRKVIVK